MIFRIYCDGGARGNPGPAGIGVVVNDEKDNLIHKFGKRIGATTNNVAEYTAVVEALTYLGEKIRFEKGDKIAFHLDSELVVSQLNGIYKVKNEKLRLLLWKVREKEAGFSMPISYQHIPREENHLADAMVNEALDSA